MPAVARAPYVDPGLGLAVLVGVACSVPDYHARATGSSGQGGNGGAVTADAGESGVRDGASGVDRQTGGGAGTSGSGAGGESTLGGTGGLRNGAGMDPPGDGGAGADGGAPAGGDAGDGAAGSNVVVGSGGTAGNGSGSGGAAAAAGAGALGGASGGAGTESTGSSGNGGAGTGSGGAGDKGRCGNGSREWLEECDDGGVLSNDGCAEDCLLEIADIVPGGTHTCARFADGSVACWGNNSEGQLGIGNDDNRGDDPNELGAELIRADFGPSERALAVSTGRDVTCVKLSAGRVKCWGANGYGQLGRGDIFPRGADPVDLGRELPELDLGTGAVVEQVECGGFHCCALLEGGLVKCWGYNNEGELGIGASGNRGDEPGELGDALPDVNLGMSHFASALTLGNYHACVLLDDSSVRCWGYGRDGQLGNGMNRSIGLNASDMGDALVPVDLGDGARAVQIDAGGIHTCARLENGAVKCWGANYYGQLGIGDSNARGFEPGQMGDDLPAVNLGESRRAVHVSAGNFFTCALLDDASVKCWGMGSGGELGQGDESDIGMFPDDMGDALSPVALGGKVLSLRNGSSHACALLETGRVKCWGWNDAGVLGLGDSSPRGDAPNEMGDLLPPVPLFGD
jgi:cysteine-rich repeat protein